VFLTDSLFAFVSQVIRAHGCSQKFPEL